MQTDKRNSKNGGQKTMRIIKGNLYDYKTLKTAVPKIIKRETRDTGAYSDAEVAEIVEKELKIPCSHQAVYNTRDMLHLPNKFKRGHALLRKQAK